jgi:hypothetical protein
VPDDDAPRDDLEDEASTPEVDDGADELLDDDPSEDTVLEDAPFEDDEDHTLVRDDLDAPSPTSPRVRIAVLVLVVFVAGLLVGRITASSDDEASDTTDAAAEAPTDGGVDFPVGDVNRTGYWGFVSLQPVVIDTFDRANDPASLGDAGEGGTWEPVSGTWGIRDDAAATAGGQGDGPFIAAVPGGRGDGLTEVTMTVVEEGAGLIFRYLDPQNYWAITANPGVGTWTVTRVIDGTSEPVGDLAGPTADDTTISVEQKGTNLRFLLDGTEYLAVTDGALADELAGGLIADGTTQGAARWNRFLVLTYGDAGSGGGAATTTSAPA